MSESSSGYKPKVSATDFMTLSINPRMAKDGGKSNGPPQVFWT